MGLGREHTRRVGVVYKFRNEETKGETQRKEGREEGEKGKQRDQDLILCPK